MSNYEDFSKLLFSVNFIGGAGKLDLSDVSSSSDIRTEVNKQGTEFYQFYYTTLTNLAEFEALGYYDNPANDIGSDSEYDREYDELPAGLNPSLSAVQLQVIQNVLHTSLSDAYSVTFEDVAKIRFNDSDTANADIVYGQTTDGQEVDSQTGGYELDYSTIPASDHNKELKHGDIWLNEDATVFWDNSAKGTLSYITILHETLHALGADIYRPENRVNQSLNFDPISNPLKFEIQAIDNQKYTVTSYKFLDGMEPPATANDEVTPFGLQILDIAALQEIYGRNYDTRKSSTTYSDNTAFASSRPSEAFIYTIWDGGGTDTIDAGDYDVEAIIDLRQGMFSSIGYNAEGNKAVDNLAIAFYTIIENAKGTVYNDILIGNAWNNRLEGDIGNDRIFGDGMVIDSDAVVGSVWDNATGALKWEANGGTKYANDKSGRDTLIGGAGDDHLYGGKGADILRGGADDDYLDGGNDDNTDVLEGGTGSDTYILHGDHSVSPDRIIDPVQLPGDQDKIVVDGVEDPDSVMYARFADDLYIYANGGLIAVVKDQYKDPANKPIKTVEIKDDNGAALGTDDLDNIPKEKIRKTGGPHTPPDTDPPTTPPPRGPDETETREQYTPIVARRDPLVIDFDGDGNIEITNPSTASIYFDMDNDGFGEAVSWVSGQDALLVRDLNNNGNIDNANELFGTSTTNGFAVLKSIDSNNDNVIDASDAAWSTLKVWNDENENGYVEDGELYTMADLGYISISVPSVNTINSTITTTESSVAIGQRDFFMDDVNSAYLGSYTVDPEALTQPNLRGYSNIKDLDIQMSIDNVGTGNLLGRMQALSVQTIEEFFGNFAANKGAFDGILYRWAGVDAINPSSRGIYMDDARKLEFLEAYLGENFEQARFPEPNPLSLAALQIMNTYNSLRDSLFTQVMFQVFGDQLFETSAQYYSANGEIVFETTPVLSEDILNILGTAGASAANKLAYWSNIAWFIDSVRGNLSGFTTDELNWLNAAVALSDNTLDWSDITTNYTVNDDQTLTGTTGDDFLSGAGGNDTITGGEGNDTLHGNAGTDVITGGDGNDFITGGDNHDELLAGAGNDTINDGAGSDMMEGGTGDDLYVWAGGADDFIFDESGTDTIRVAVGGPITLERRFTDDLVVNVNGNNTLTIQNQLNNAAGGVNQIERIENQFGETIFDLTTFTGSVISRGGSGDDVIHGITAGASPHELMYGMGGNDTIYGGIGSDAINGDEGNDTLYGESGNDGLYAGEGNDVLDGGEGNDVLTGNNGDDTYYYNGGLDTFNEIGFGTDRIILSGAFANQSYVIERRVNGNDGSNDMLIIFDAENQIRVDWQFNSSAVIEYIHADEGAVGTSLLSLPPIITYGSAGNDTITGSAGLIDKNDTIYAGDGNDTIWDDTNTLGQSLGGGSDIIYGGNGDDTIRQFFGNDTIYGEAGNDTVIFHSTSGLASASSFDGGAGRNKAAFLTQNAFGSNPSIAINIADPDNSWAQGRHPGNGSLEGPITILRNVTEIESNYNSTYMYGGNADEIFRLTGGVQNWVEAGAGNDKLYSSYISDGDTLNGGSGDDTYYVGNGIDAVFDSSGIDTLMFGYASGNMLSINTITAIEEFSTHLRIGNGTAWTYLADYLIGGSQVEYLGDVNDGMRLEISTWNTWAWGTAGSDTINGTSDADIIIGRGGSDTISGGAGDDTLGGNQGNDTVSGGDGNDIISGGDGTNTLNGDADDDLFQSGYGIDTIYGGTGNDTVETSFVVAGAVAHGEDGDDTIDFSARRDLVFLGNASARDFSIINMLAGTAVTMTAWDASSSIAFVSFDGFETVKGSALHDWIIGDAGNNIIIGQSGNDRLEGGVGDDTYYVGLDHDTIEDNGDGIDTVILDDSIVVDWQNFTWEIGNFDSGSTANDLKFIFTPTQSLTLFNQTDTAADQVEYMIINGEYVDALTIQYWRSGTSAGEVMNGDTHIGVGFINDRIFGYGGSDNLRGLMGDDVILAGDGDDYLFGDDTARSEFYVGAGNDKLYGGLGADRLYGGAGNDQLFGEDDDDILFGDTGDDLLDGGAGNDNLRGLEGNDEIIGGDGDDYLFGDDTTRDPFFIGAGFDILRGGLGADRLYGGAGGDVLYGGDGADRLYGDADGDDLFGEDGADIMYGGDGNDALFGGSGADTLYGEEGSDLLDGGSDNDILRGGAGNDNLRGRDGDDRLYGDADSDTLRGEAGNDYLYGDDAADLDGGSDLLDGGADNDRLYGYAGSDELRGGDGEDRLWGGTGGDILRGGNDRDYLYGEDDDDILLGEIGDDLLYGGVGHDLLVGGDGVDLLDGEDGDDNLQGDAGNDTLRGRAGFDVLEGGDGDDRLYGGDDSDYLIGGLGVDNLYGEGGGDVFYFGMDGYETGVMDIVRDFSVVDNDSVSIADILSYDSTLGDILSDFVQLQEVGGVHTRLRVDIDGAGTDHTWTNLAQIQNTIGLNLTDLVTNGNLIAE